MRPPTALDPHSLFDFGSVAHKYERWYGTPTGQAQDRVQKEDVLSLLRPAQRGDRLLDVGCGTGHWSRFFASLGYAVTGVDISREMIRVARSQPAPRCVFDLADACALPFAGGSFDVVAAMAVLAFVSDIPSMLDEMFRCVKRHGSVLIGALNRRAPLNRHRLATGRQPYASGRLVDPEELRHLLQRFGPVRMVASSMPSSDRGQRPGRQIGHRMVPASRSFSGPFIVAEARRWRNNTRGLVRGRIMPTYEYQCEQCGHRFERFQNMSDARVKVCPECGGAVRRLIGTGAAVIFRGSGFHATDYGNPGPSCGRERPCCGRDTPCDTKPCER